ncbi:MAG: SDR family oxidoreductase [Candidatus Aenigmarchaeota archaeon]|nr:SDR family oxidoreductase [Candidatus Aenigmarchaeota archaeon]
MIFLLGHRGFVGSAIAKYLGKNNVDFTGIDRENYNSFAGKKCDIFINAGGSSKKRLADQDPKKDFELNVLSTLNTVLDFKFKKYILVSSVEVYNDVFNPINNKEDKEIDPNKLSNYGFSKWLCEQIVKKNCKNWLIFRLGGMVGSGIKKNAIFDLMNSGSLFVSPKSEYQYINTDDVARFIYLLRNRKNEIFNLCGSGTITLEDVAKHMGKNLNRNLYKLRKEIYNINIMKIKKIGKIPETKETIFKFVD